MRRLRSLAELPVDIQKVIQSGAPRTTGLECPWCEGGKSHERSLGVYLIGGEAVLKCYRLSCGEGAKVLLDGETRERAIAASNGFEPRPYLGELATLSPDWVLFMQRKFRINAETLLGFGVRATSSNGLYLPVRGPMGSDRGGLVRRFDGWGQKAEAFKIADEPWMAWYGSWQHDKGCVIVEDQLSAMRATQLGWDAVALLGTTMSMEKAAEINRWVRGDVTLALDADAFRQACKIAQQHSWIDRVVMLKHGDLKDVSDNEIAEVLE